MIQGDDCSWESDALQRLAAMDELRAFNHNGFSGSQWTPCAISCNLNRCGTVVGRRGRSGEALYYHESVMDCH